MRFDKRRNIIIAIAAAIIFLASIYAYGAARGAAPGGASGHVPEEYSGIVRFHVIANSNSDYDQEMKLAVRDRVLEEMNKKLIAETVSSYDEGGAKKSGSAGNSAATAKLDIGEVRDLIIENLDEIERIAEEVINEYGSDYDAHAELGVRFIPKKTYGEVTFPAGNYEALNITNPIGRTKEMAAVKELLRSEADGGISFGDYELAAKTKLKDFNHQGDLYKVKTFREITKLERNDLFVYESVPGTAVEHFRATAEQVEFQVSGPEDAQITLGLEEDTEYEITVDGADAGRIKTNLGGKLMLSVELGGRDSASVKVVKA